MPRIRLGERSPHCVDSIINSVSGLSIPNGDGVLSPGDGEVGGGWGDDVSESQFGDDGRVHTGLPRRASLQDVGARAGVSFQTASKVLRGMGTVSPATRRRVLDAAAELGYVTNSLASGLASRETRSIGFIASGLASFVLAPLLLGAEREARRHGYYVIFNFIDHEASDGQRTLRQLIERRVDGIVSSALTLERDAGYGAMLRDEVPSVSTHPLLVSGVPIVSQDTRREGREATRHLLDLGHRRIATIVGPASGLPPGGRWEGYVDALESAGVDADERLVVSGGWSVEGGYAAMVRLLESQRPMTAIVCQNDHMAMGAIRALQERGRRVPDDYSVVGCDDMDFARFINPPLTTIQISFERTGVAAVRLLIDRLREEVPIPERIVLPSSLIVRESTSAPN